MNASLCIHGHFYQPPREDPWLGIILPEASAAPAGNWNERILRESYAPLAWARRLDAAGRISEILNCYEWISFNAGPTLLRWMLRHSPATVARMREGDARSLERWGHGNALAQVYHHPIMPLAGPEDREVETRWAVDDFRAVFGRYPEGIWLPEAAVDTATLETLAGQGLRFVLLAPRQAKAVRINKATTPVTEETLFIGEPYRLSLPSGASLAVIFYHGALSRSIAFNSLLRDGEQFWSRLSEAASTLAAQGQNPLLTLGTDGETYGHHFTFGEMALAHVLAQARAGRDGLGLTNLAAYIAAHPPTREVLLHEPSSWSCVHGVERWRSDCGCSDGGHPGWNQKWRAPLRRALNYTRAAVEAHFAVAGAECLVHPRQALLAYGQVLAEPQTKESYAARWFYQDLTGETSRRDRAWKLLAAQEQSLASFASCAWFFDDLARIEPENALTCALRSLELMRETGGSDICLEFLQILGQARSNQKDKGSGHEIFLTDILPRQATPASLCLLACLLLRYRGDWPRPGLPATWSWPRTSVTIIPENELTGPIRGTAVIRAYFENQGASCSWELTFPSADLQEADGTFVSLARASLTAHAPGWEETRSVADLSKPMRDYLQGEILIRREMRLRSRLRAQARHILSLMDPWAEEQRDILHSCLLAHLVPYLVLECVIDTRLEQGKRDQALSFLAGRLSPDSALLASRLLEEEILARLNEIPASSSAPYADACLADMIRRAKSLVPTDFWEIQNRIWQAGPENFPALASALNFAVNHPG